MKTVLSVLLWLALPFAAFAADPSAGVVVPPPAGLPDIDKSVDPCDNFYRYACGPWLAANPIPADQSNWGSFKVLQQDNQALLRTALDRVVANPIPDSKRIGDFYSSCMAEAAIDSKGAAPIRPLLAQIDALGAKSDLAGLLAALHRVGVNALFGFGAETDFQDARQDIAAVAQAGLGLPNRDFYLRAGAADDKRRAAYAAHVGNIFRLLGDTPAVAAAKAGVVIKLETALARKSLSLAELNDPHLTNHKKSMAALAKLAPSFGWPAYFAASGAPPFATLNIAEPGFIKKVEAEIQSRSLDDLKAYLTWQTAHEYAPWLSKDFVDENFSFYGKVLSGAPELRPRWKRCVQLTDSLLGEDLGKYFVEAAFGPEHKARMLVMVHDIKAAFDSDIDQLVWMGPKTKAQAHAKLAAIVDKIGYPDHWRDYSRVVVAADDLVGNIESATRFANDRDLAKIGKKHDKSEWSMTPPTVNAYYDPTENDINFPAGILQPPFFTMTADDAVNYGAIGVVIGHEMTHGFDDQGRQYDKDGNLKDWWSKEDAKQFGERAQCFVDQYGGFTAIDDVKQNGQATLGENLADNGGIRIALAAYLARHAGKSDAPINGFTAPQRYFLGYAQMWCSNMRDEAKRTLAMSDVHSLPEFRVNGALANSTAFAHAFNCQPTAAMVRGDKACRLW